MRDARSAAAIRRPASPLARRLARAAGIDLGDIAGSGPAGRVVKRDVEDAVAKGVARGMTVAAAEAVVSATTPATAPARERIMGSGRTIPQVRLAADCRIDALLAARGKASLGTGRDACPEAATLTALLLKALAMALVEVPGANVTWSEAGVQRHVRGDVAVSIAVDGGYVLGVVNGADTLTAGEVARALAGIAERAREGRLPAELAFGGASVIHNLGMHGVTLIDPILEPPRATSLAIGAAEPRAVAIGGRLAVATVIACTLAADPRAVEPKVAAELLARIKALIEAPGPLLA